MTDENKFAGGCCLFTLLYLPFGVLAELTKHYSGTGRKRRRRRW